MLKKDVSNFVQTLCLRSSPEGEGVDPVPEMLAIITSIALNILDDRKKSITLMRVGVMHYNYGLRFEVSIAMKW